MAEILLAGRLEANVTRGPIKEVLLAALLSGKSHRSDALDARSVI